MTSFSPAESLVLLNPNRAWARELVKVTLLSLMAQGLVRIEEISEKRWFGTRRTVFVRPGRKPEWLPPPAASLFARVQAAQTEGGRMEDLVTQARKAYGTNFEKFKSDLIVPRLVASGLITRERFLWLFPKWQLTPQGLMEQGRIKSDIARARTIPALLNSNPAEAAAIALAVGSNILLVEELRPHYRRLSEAMRSRGDNGGDGADGSWSCDDETHDAGNRHGQAPDDPGAAHASPHHFGGPDLGSLGSFDLGSLDAGAFDALDAGMASFDAGFDSAAGGDGGGDGGGGDGGGNGGGGGD